MSAKAAASRCSANRIAADMRNPTRLLNWERIAGGGEGAAISPPSLREGVQVQASPLVEESAGVLTETAGWLRSRMMLNLAKARRTKYAGSSSNGLAAKFSDAGRAW